MSERPLSYRILSGPHYESSGSYYYVIREADGTEQILPVEEHEALLDALAEARSN